MDAHDTEQNSMEHTAGNASLALAMESVSLPPTITAPGAENQPRIPEDVCEVSGMLSHAGITLDDALRNTPWSCRGH